MAYSTIPKGNLYMDTVLYTGNGSTQNITGVGFKPDWVWVKQRGGTTNHKTSDAVRGVTKALQPNDSDAEATDSNGITAFNSNGFSLGNGGDYNGSSNTQVAWNWKANGAGSANTDGAIGSVTASANQTAGFSIVKYEGTGNAVTVGHGLGAVPKMMIIKNRASAEEWGVYHVANGNTHVQYLNTSNAKIDDAGFWNDTTPTNLVFTVGNSSRVNQNGSAMIAYCFAEKQGYSKFGSYTGNGATLGPFVYCGFKPSFIIVKKTSGSGSWWMHDNKTSPFNVATQVIVANSNATETNGVGQMDFLSNGFKLRDATDATNSSGGSYIYMAFAKNPFVATSGSDAIPATAR